jgi:hypothetical protein
MIRRQLGPIPPPVRPAGRMSAAPRVRASGLGPRLGGRASPGESGSATLVTGPRIFGAIRGLVAISGRVCAGTGARVCACVRGQVGFRRQVTPPSSTPSTGLRLQLGVTVADQLGSTRSLPPRASALMAAGTGRVRPPGSAGCCHAPGPIVRACVRSCAYVLARARVRPARW